MIARRTRARTRRGPEISLAPLIDMVFLLLIFLLVTTTFERETGVELRRPEAASADALPQTPVRLALTRAGRVHAEGRELGLEAVQSYVRAALAGRTARAVVLEADRDAPAGLIVDVMDECRLAGAEELALAADQEQR